MDNFKKFAKTVVDFRMPVLLIISDQAIKMSGNIFPTRFEIDEVEKKIKLRARNEVADDDIFLCLQYSEINETVIEEEFDISLQSGAEVTMGFND